MKKLSTLVLVITLAVVLIQPKELLASTEESSEQSKKSSVIGWVVSDGIVLVLGGAGTVMGVYATAFGNGMVKAGAGAGDTFALGWKVGGEVIRGGGAIITLLSLGTMAIYFGGKYLFRSSEGAVISKEILDQQFIDMKAARVAWEADLSNPYLKTAYLTKKLIYKKWLIDVTQEKALLDILEHEIASIELELEDTKQVTSILTDNEKIAYLNEAQDIENSLELEETRAELVRWFKEAESFILDHNSV